MIFDMNDTFNIEVIEINIDICKELKKVSVSWRFQHNIKKTVMNRSSYIAIYLKIINHHKFIHIIIMGSLALSFLRRRTYFLYL